MAKTNQGIRVEGQMIRITKIMNFKNNNKIRMKMTLMMNKVILKNKMNCWIS